VDVWRPLAVGALAAALTMAVGGCGDEDGEEGAQAPPPVAKPEDFPRAEGRTLAGLLRDLPRGGPLLFPSVSEL
jgi:hypothetical protein